MMNDIQNPGYQPEYHLNDIHWMSIFDIRAGIWIFWISAQHWFEPQFEKLVCEGNLGAGTPIEQIEGRAHIGL